MNILMISPLCPLPLEKGGAVRIWNVAKQLSKHHSVDLVCFIRQEGERRYEDELKKVFKSVTFIKRRSLFERSSLTSGVFAPFRFGVSNISLLGDTLFSSRPLISHLYDSEEMRSFILESDRSANYDLLYAETFYSIASLRDDLGKLKTKLLLIEQNIESKAYERQAQGQQNKILKKLMMLDIEKMRSEERFFWDKVSLLGGLSNVDVEVITQICSRSVMLVENGVDVEWFSEPLCSRTENEVLFVGSLSYFQNIDSLRWLLEQIWPRVLKERPDAHLRIVGRGADASLKEYVHSKGHTIDESVDDIRTAFQHATVLIAPIRAGSGTKYKVLEAMASSMPVITTAVGAEGLAIVHGTHALLEEDAGNLAGAILGLLNTPSMRTDLGKKGFEFVSTYYDWQSIIIKFEEQLKKLL